ncbi:ammonium transporter AmtB-like domain-containing protein [Podospora appendiculata]|uniref:Ammonium transporter AmtB-like domain-containing protein n=1 Tax=Podospora appendiculata TaxID=314037 RepID=A0AAE0XHI2_9PEZI|nr:ammonium transporter AmtB-like domain-containing protein [Podospora appendiculata]
MVSSAFVFVMIPSLSLIYSGLGNRSFALTLFRLPMVTAAFIGLQWVLWGYTLTFTGSSMWWGGETRGNALQDVLVRPVSTGDGSDGSQIPELLFLLYEAMFASFTAALVCGGTMHRARPARFIIFISIWALFIYDPVARWSWSEYGWGKQFGTMDFAGGTPVHIVSGSTVAAFAVFCSIESKDSPREFFSEAVDRVKRRLGHLFKGFWSVLRIVIMVCTYGYLRPPSYDLSDQELGGSQEEDGTRPVFQPYNVNYLVLGTSLLWFGWAGFNGGSALGANMRAVSAWAATHFAACAGGATGMIWIWIWKALPDPDNNTNSQASVDQGGEEHHAEPRQFENLSVYFFCDGAIAGLVAITPAAGYVPIWTAVIFGVVAAIAVNLLKKETEIFLRNDPLQIFAVHAGGGLVGMILTGIFADRSRRVGYQILDGVSGMAYSFLMTLVILYAMKLVAYMFMPTPWKQAAEYDDEFQATMDQQWRHQLDAQGRPRAPPFQRPRPQQAVIPMQRYPPPPDLPAIPSPELQPVNSI